ncbi:MAG: tRNA (adenosine(37)-N6)-dimethylallyltransferase MiaA [Patescibacteria group bacterium]
MPKSKLKVIIIVGPTASGKSSLAIKLAKRFKGEIISADSRQVYKGMDIGTGKVTKQEQRMIPHHLLDVADPKKDFSVARYIQLAEKAILDIHSRGKLPIICGGTGFYIDALLGTATLPEVPPNKKLRKHFNKFSAQHLFEMLRKLDPRRAHNIDRHNKRRLIRALEIIAQTGKPIPEPKPESKYDTLWVGINLSKEKLAKRIEKRLDDRLKHGMVTEVKKLHNQGVGWKRLENFGLEYRWIAHYLQNKVSKEEMRNLLLRDIIKYSKRQMTWWKRNKEINWITSTEQIEKLIRLH